MYGTLPFKRAARSLPPQRLYNPRQGTAALQGSIPSLYTSPFLGFRLATLLRQSRIHWARETPSRSAAR